MFSLLTHDENCILFTEETIDVLSPLVSIMKENLYKSSSNYLQKNASFFFKYHFRFIFQSILGLKFEQSKFFNKLQ